MATGTGHLEKCDGTRDGDRDERGFDEVPDDAGSRREGPGEEGAGIVGGEGAAALGAGVGVSRIELGVAIAAEHGAPYGVGREAGRVVSTVTGGRGMGPRAKGP